MGTDIAMLRFGQIGDVITAVQNCNIINCDLFVCESKNNLLNLSKTSNGYATVVQAISDSLKTEIVILTSIQQLKKYNTVYFFPQKRNIQTDLFLGLLRFFLPTTKIQYWYEGANYFHFAVEKQNTYVTKLIETLLFKKKSVSVVICWKGKESQKNINFVNLEDIINILIAKGHEVTLLGDKHLSMALETKSFNNLSGKTSLISAFEYIKAADIVISVDTGLLHYAVAQEKLVIALIAHRYDLALWYPFGSKTILVSETTIDCRKKECLKCTASQCVNSPDVMWRINKLFNPGKNYEKL